MNSLSPEFIDALIVALLILAACVIGLVANAVADKYIAKRTNRILATLEALTSASANLERKINRNVEANVVNVFTEKHRNGK